MFPQMNTRACRVYLILRGVMAFSFHMMVTAVMVYYITIVGVDPLGLVLIGTVFEATIFLFEIPTGVVADVYSRRLSVIVGVLLLGMAMLIEGSLPIYTVILLTQIVGGIGETFVSGATEAWIADEVGEGWAGQIFMRGSQASSVGALLGIASAVVIGTLMPVNVPVMLAGIVLIGLGVFLIVHMPEDRSRKVLPDRPTSFGSLFAVFREGASLVQRTPTLIVVLMIGVIVGIASEGFDMLWHKHLIDSFRLPGEPVIWIGAINFSGLLIGLGLKEIVYRKVDLSRDRSLAYAALLLNLLAAVGVLIIALTTDLAVVMAALLLVAPIRETSAPVYTAWINQSLDPKVRATILSMSAQLGSLGEIAGGPAVGFIGKRVSVRAALAVSAIIWAAATPLFRRSLRSSPQSVPAMETES